MSSASTLFAADGGTQLKEMEASGMSLGTERDGTLRASVERLVLRRVSLRTALGSLMAPKLTLTGVRLRMRVPGAAQREHRSAQPNSATAGTASASAASSGAGAPLDPSFTLLGLSAEEAQLEAAELMPALPLGAAMAPPNGPVDADWRLDALAALEGLLHVFIRDAAWVVDAEITMPITGGRLDFDRVVVDHVGPNSAMGMSPNGIYIDAPSGARTELFRFKAAQLAGARVEARGGLVGRVNQRGQLDLRAFVQAWLDAGSTPLGALAGRHVERMLDRTKLNGELRLGDGALGTASHHLVLAGQSQGKNRLSVSAAVLGHRLVLRMPALCASHGAFELLGCRGSAGPLTATLEIHATGLSQPAGPATAAGICVNVHHLCVRQLALGQVDGVEASGERLHGA